MNLISKILIITLNIICSLGLFALAVNFFEGSYDQNSEVKIVGFFLLSAIAVILINMIAWIKKPYRLKKLEIEANILKKKIEIKELKQNLDNHSS